MMGRKTINIYIVNITIYTVYTCKICVYTVYYMGWISNDYQHQCTSGINVSIIVSYNFGKGSLSFEKINCGFQAYQWNQSFSFVQGHTCNSLYKHPPNLSTVRSFHCRTSVGLRVARAKLAIGPVALWPRGPLRKMDHTVLDLRPCNWPFF